MKKRVGLYAAAALGLAFTTSANATLFDRGNGMIYDSDQDLTWLQDANYAKTSGYDANGRMTWSSAMKWAENLVFGDYDDWRLPTIKDSGDVGCQYGIDCGYDVDTSGSELAYMWYNILGNIPYYHGNGPGLTSTSADGVEVLNLQSYSYWSADKYEPYHGFIWYFDTREGAQGYRFALDEIYAWAVRDGDVAAATVPLPGTLLLLAAGLVGVAGAKRRRC